MTPEEARELEIMEDWARAAFEAATSDPGIDIPWEGLPDVIKLRWCAVADAVIDRYDEEWRSRKAGM